MIIKNSNIRRSIFENRYVIFVIIFAVILALYFIRILNENAKEKNRKKSIEVQNTVIEEAKKDVSNKPIISTIEIPKEQKQNNTKIIDEFITYCNEQEIQKAYDLLTQECKEEIFASNIQYFKANYVDKIFKTKKVYTIQDWIISNRYTYKVTIVDDMLSSGKVATSQNTIEDYYTIVVEKNEIKLNINNYIGRNEIRKENMQKGVKITILSKDIYKEYEAYDIIIENTTQNAILLNSRSKGKFSLFSWF